MELNLVELTKSKDITFKVGKINFKGYKKLKNNALELSERIRATSVSEDNIKDVKKELAAVNKDIKEIEDIRKLIKNQILVPYTDFENKIKEIVNIVKEADNIVREQVRELEELERDNKTEVIKQMFNDKLRHYKYANLVDFETFYKPNMSNKTTSLNIIEEQMSEWMEKIELDFNVINENENREDLTIEYLKHYNLAKAMSDVSFNNKQKEKINEVAHKNMEVNKQFIFIIKDEKEAKLVELLLKENKINYRKEVR